MSDAQLDAAFHAAWLLKDQAAMAYYRGMILERVQSPWAYLGGLIGVTKFPLWEADESATGGFSQVGTAREATAASAGNLASAAGSVFKLGAGAAALAVIALLALAIALRA